MMAFTLRPATADDAALLLRIYAATRQHELALAGWDAAQQDAFVRMQFGAQDRHYRQQFPAAQHAIVQLGDADVGRLVVDRSEDAICLVDIALLPAHRGHGLGTEVVGALLAEAAAAVRAVTLHVAVDNPAASLYRRLGFVAVEDRGLHTLMRWLPHGAANGLVDGPVHGLVTGPVDGAATGAPIDFPSASSPRSLETTP